jgi:hypothetical protein
MLEVRRHGSPSICSASPSVRLLRVLEVDPIG